MFTDNIILYNICPITLTVYAYLISYLDVDTCCWLLLHKTVLRLILFWLPQDLKRECSKDGNIHITKSNAKKIVQTLLFLKMHRNWAYSSCFEITKKIKIILIFGDIFLNVIVAKWNIIIRIYILVIMWMFRDKCNLHWKVYQYA